MSGGSGGVCLVGEGRVWVYTVVARVCAQSRELMSGGGGGGVCLVAEGRVWMCAVGTGV